MPSYDLSEQQMKFMSMAFGSLRSNIPQHLKVFSSDIENLRNICSRVVLCQSIETHLDTICSLAPPIKSTVWVNGEDKTINLIDSGKVIKRIEAKSGTRPINLAMTRQGFLVYAVYDHHQSNVCIVTKTRRTKLLRSITGNQLEYAAQEMMNFWFLWKAKMKLKSKSLASRATSK